MSHGIVGDRKRPQGEDETEPNPQRMKLNVGPHSSSNSRGLLLPDGNSGLKSAEGQDMAVSDAASSLLHLLTSSKGSKAAESREPKTGTQTMAMDDDQGDWPQNGNGAICDPKRLWPSEVRDPHPNDRITTAIPPTSSSLSGGNISVSAEASPESKWEQSISNHRPASTRAARSESNASSGRWTVHEHEAFLNGLERFGRRWARIAEVVLTRTPDQVRSHAQKYFIKLGKDKAPFEHL